jgi:hypothetical protein
MRTKVAVSSVNDGGRKLVEELTPSCVTRSLELCLFFRPLFVFLSFFLAIVFIR